MTVFIDLDEKELAKPVRLPTEGRRSAVHVFDRRSVDAINGALAAGRTLLVRGRPGVGKSQLARAAAAKLGRPLVSMIIDGQTEPKDLFWRLDSVARLARAQLMGAMGPGTGIDVAKVRAELDERRFTVPGPLWWAFDWTSAEAQARFASSGQREAPDGWTAGDGVVVLLDEMDKADTSVPNGLLGALGSGWFEIPGEVHDAAGPDSPSKARVEASGAEPPLIIVTTNEERALPDAFLRRCLVLQLELPEGDALNEFLVKRGRAHLGQRLAKDVLVAAAEMLVEDRAEMEDRGLAPAGLAEYLDLLWALSELAPKDPQGQLDYLDRLRDFTFKKHPEDGPR